MKNILIYQYLIAFITIASTISCTHNNSEKLTIATAANMQFAMQEIISSFEKETGIDCQKVVASSGKLTAQIKEGAPFDILVSADMKFPTELHKLKFTLNEPKIYAYGKLVIWSMIDTIKPTFELLHSNKIKHIAISNPKTAPYGVAAFEVLRKKNILSQLEHKFVYGESVAQTNQFITTMASELGFTAKSVVVSPKMIGKGNYFEINDSLYSPISQGIVLLKNGSSNISHKQKFYNFLISNKGKNILTKFGYSVKL